MVLVPIITIAARVAQQVFKHRKSIYKVLTAQDKYIDRSMRAGGYGRQARYGVRHGALAGSVIGSIINDASDSPGNGIQKPFKSPTPSGKPYKTRGRFSVRSNRRYSRQSCPSPRNRYSYSRRRY